MTNYLTLADIDWQFIAGGLALFLYGMHLMGENLTKFAGNKLRYYIERYTENPLLAALIGILFTGLIQSSSGTTVIVISLVSAGYMQLKQAIPVILGANVGTTVTAILIGFNIDYVSYFIAIIGVCLVLFAGRKQLLYTGSVLLGFGMLFIGLEMMGDALKQLQYLEGFNELIVHISHYPLLATLTGAFITGIVQSSSAVIGIIQVLFNSEAITLQAAIGLIFGANIGTTVTGALACLSTASLAAKRTSLFHFIFNVAVSLIFLLLLAPYVQVLLFLTNYFHLNRLMMIAVGHFLFNTIGMFMFLPLRTIMVRLLEKLLPGEDDVLVKTKAFKLEATFRRDFPELALKQIEDEMLVLADLAKQAIIASKDFVLTGNHAKQQLANSIEEVVNQKDTELTHELVLLANEEIANNLITTALNDLEIVKNMERISDLAQNLTEYYEMMFASSEKLPDIVRAELEQIYAVLERNYTVAIKVFVKREKALFSELQNDEQELDELEAKLRNLHLQRLTHEYVKPTVFTSIFVDILGTIERIGDHAFNIGRETFAVVKEHRLENNNVKKLADELRK